MQYTVMNGPSAGAAAVPKVTTGTSIKTMLQIKTLVPARIIEWDASFDGSAAATPGQVELVECVAVFATVTAYVANDITPLDAEAVGFGDPTSNYISVGTSASGYTSTVEGSVVAPVRQLDFTQLIAPTNQYIKQFPLGRTPYFLNGKSVRVRVTFGSAINMACGVALEF